MTYHGLLKGAMVHAKYAIIVEELDGFAAKRTSMNSLKSSVSQLLLQLNMLKTKPSLNSFDVNSFNTALAHALNAAVEAQALPLALDLANFSRCIDRLSEILEEKVVLACAALSEKFSIYAKALVHRQAVTVSSASWGPSKCERLPCGARRLSYRVALTERC
jgi:hypothetical protein